MITRNLLAYAKVCNVEVADLIMRLQRDPFAREQFNAWKKSIDLISRLLGGVVGPFADATIVAEAEAYLECEARWNSLPPAKAKIAESCFPYVTEKGSQL
jgi:hypothetical protein